MNLEAKAERQSSTVLSRSSKEVSEFIEASDPYKLDLMLSQRIILDADVRYFNLRNALYESACTGRTDNIQYLLTFLQPVDVNVKVNGRTSLHRSAECIFKNPGIFKTMIDFNADRGHIDNMGKTPLAVAKAYGNKKAELILSTYFPTEEEKLLGRLECKTNVDNLFKKSYNMSRYKHDEISIKFSSITSFLSSDLESLRQSTMYVDSSLASYLLHVALDKDQALFIECLCEVISGKSYDGTNKSCLDDPDLFLRLKKVNYPNAKALVDKLAYIGLVSSRATGGNFMCVQVLCSIVMLFHKFIYLDNENMFDFVQTLLFEMTDRRV